MAPPIFNPFLQEEYEQRWQLEVLRNFEHAKLIEECPYKKPRWRPSKRTNYKYDPNKSDTVQVFVDPMAQWRR